MTGSRPIEVLVVGAGPAGAAAATQLARGGARVRIVDKAVFPRDKCCGDGLTAGALRRLEGLGLEPGRVASWEAVATVQVRSPSGRTIAFPLPQDGLHAAVARRADLDAELVVLARDAGAVVAEGVTAGQVVAEGERLAVTTSGEVRGVTNVDYVVAADGAWSPLRKQLVPDATTYLGEWHAFRQYFAGAVTAAARDLWVWFEPDLLPGYAWSFPLPDGRVNVGFGVRREPGRPTRELGERWRELLTRPHIRAVLGDAEPEAPHKAWPIPATVEAAATAVGGRVLFVGDAARVADPMTGEGIGQALETGELAARAIVVAGAGAPQVAASVYERSLGGMRMDNRLADGLSRALAHRRGARAAVRVAGLTPWTRRNFARWLFEDYPRAVVGTPRRWRAGMFTPAGAFAEVRT